MIGITTNSKDTVYTFIKMVNVMKVIFTKVKNMVKVPTILLMAGFIKEIGRVGLRRVGAGRFIRRAWFFRGTGEGT